MLLTIAGWLVEVPLQDDSFAIASLRLTRSRLPTMHKIAYENPAATERYLSSSTQYAVMLASPLKKTLQHRSVRYKITHSNKIGLRQKVPYMVLHDYTKNQMGEPFFYLLVRAHFPCFVYDEKKEDGLINHGRHPGEC